MMRRAVHAPDMAAMVTVVQKDKNDVVLLRTPRSLLCAAKPLYVSF